MRCSFRITCEMRSAPLGGRQHFFGWHIVHLSSIDRYNWYRCILMRWYIYKLHVVLHSNKNTRLHHYLPWQKHNFARDSSRASIITLILHYTHFLSSNDSMIDHSIHTNWLTFRRLFSHVSAALERNPASRLHMDNIYSRSVWEGLSGPPLAYYESVGFRVNSFVAAILPPYLWRSRSIGRDGTRVNCWQSPRDIAKGHVWQTWVDAVQKLLTIPRLQGRNVVHRYEKKLRLILSNYVL